MSQPNEYWGEISREDASDALELGYKYGASEALAHLCEKYPGLDEYLLSWARSDGVFHWLSSKTSTESCVELGSGWGSLTLGLSKYFDQMISLEIIEERLKFQMLRARDEGTTNIIFIRASALNPPLRRGAFDLVVANGLLEWIGLSQPTEKVIFTQLEFLRRCRSLLKNDGCLYIGIENRVGAGYFAGVRDHSGYPFTSLMPRALASQFVRLFDRVLQPGSTLKRTEAARGRYLTWTYSIPTYLRLLEETGFDRVEAYWCYPSYNHPRFSGPLTSNDSPQEFARWILQMSGPELPIHKRIIAELLAKSPGFVSAFLSRVFWPNIILIAYRKARVPEDALLPIRNSIKMSGQSRKHGMVSRLQLRNGKLISLTRFTRFPVQTVSEGTVVVGRDGNRHLGVREEPIKEGRAFHKFSVEDNQRLIQWLIAFHARTSRQRMTKRFLETQFQRIAESKEFASFTPALKGYAHEIFSPLLSMLPKADFRVVPEHGDLWTRNILIESSGALLVLDWEYFTNDGSEFFDLLYFTLTSMLGSVTPVETFWENLFGRGHYSEIARENITSFAKHLCTPIEDSLKWVPYVLLRAVVRHTPRGDNWTSTYSPLKRILSQWSEVDSSKLFPV